MKNLVDKIKKKDKVSLAKGITLIESDKKSDLKYKIELPSDLSKEEIEAAILSDEIFIKKLEGNKPKRVIVIPGKIINFVI